MSLRSTAIVFASLALGAAAPALAQSYDSPAVGEVVVQGSPYAPDVEVKSQVVSYADLDLSAEPGAWTLLRRIDGAAKTVCAPQAAQKDLKDQSSYRDCLIGAKARAVQDVNEPLVENLYRLRG